jgi:hypothetical protein
MVITTFKRYGKISGHESERYRNTAQKMKRIRRCGREDLWEAFRKDAIRLLEVQRIHNPGEKAAETASG